MPPKADNGGKAQAGRADVDGTEGTAHRALHGILRLRSKADLHLGDKSKDPKTVPASAGATQKTPFDTVVSAPGERRWRECAVPPLRWVARASLIVGLVVLAFARIDDVASIVETLWGVARPFVLGAFVAYLLNLIMVRWEAAWFPDVRTGVLVSVRRLGALGRSVATVAAIVAAIVTLVSGELADAFRSLWYGAESALMALDDNFGGLIPFAIPGIDFSDGLTDELNQLLEGFGGISGMASRLARIGTMIAQGTMDTLIAIVFALYLLAGKEGAVSGAKRAARLILPENMYDVISHVAHVADQSVSRFVFGQVLEGIVLGALCAVGMAILRLPYAATIGLVVGVGALVPIVGAWSAGIVGALMILPVDAHQAIVFVAYLLILQQIDGHVIYPNVVGATVGISSAWVLVAVFVGGGLFGIAGVFLGVPIAAAIRVLCAEWAEARERAIAEERRERKDEARNKKNDSTEK